MRVRCKLRCSWAMVAAAAACVTAGAQARITEALVFPGGAELVREAAVAAGSHEAVFACVPARIELNSLQARGEGGVRVGEIAVRTLPAAQAPQCSGQPQLDAQIRPLQQQKASLQAERDALGVQLALLRQSGDARLSPAQLDAARRQALDALRQQQQLAERQQQIDEQLAPLLAQRDPKRSGITQWHELRVRVDAAQAGSSARVLLRYRTRAAGWQPLYRAELDSVANRLRFERRAEVAQTTGESWDGVQLTLSTREPQRASQPPEPQPWLLREQPQLEARRQFDAMPMAAMAAAPKRAEAADANAPVDAPLPAFETDIDLQFRLPGAQTLASGSERRSLSLERLDWSAELFTQVVPAEQARAYRVALLKQPQGFFPPGQLQLLRDGEWVGETAFAPGSEAELQLGFGIDERLRVLVEPEQRDGAERGLTGSRRELQIQRRYRLENTGKQALAVQVLEAAPQSQHESVRVQTQFEPAPLPGDWRGQPGLRQWRFPLAPGAQQAITARYQLSAPKDLPLIGWP